MANEQEHETMFIAAGEVNEFTFNKSDGKQGKGYNVKDQNGIIYTTFSSSVSDILGKAGEQRKIKYKETQRGQFINYNITDVADETGNFTDKGKSHKGGGKADPQKVESIERQVALKAAVELLCSTHKEGDEVDPQTVTALAEDFKNWLRGETKQEGG